MLKMIIANKEVLIDENQNKVNYYEVKELFTDYLKLEKNLTKGKRINFSEMVDHMYNYIFVGKDLGKLLFKIVN